MRCQKSTFNGQGSRLIIVALQVGVVKIYVATMEVFMKKVRRVELSSPQKLRSPPWMLMFFFFSGWFFFFVEFHLIYDQTQGSSLVFLTL